MQRAQVKEGQRYQYGKGKKMRNGTVVKRLDVEGKDRGYRLAINWDTGGWNWVADVIGNLLAIERGPKRLGS